MEIQSISDEAPELLYAQQQNTFDSEAPKEQTPMTSAAKDSTKAPADILVVSQVTDKPRKIISFVVVVLVAMLPFFFEAVSLKMRVTIWPKTWFSNAIE